MRYDWGEAVEHPVGSREFYEEVDRRFFQNAREFMPWTRRPFDALIDFGRLATEDVLEIGVGAGSHARLLAESARSFTGIDLTETAVATTRQRFTMMGLPAERIVRMDAESLQFPFVNRISLPDTLRFNPALCYQEPNPLA